MKITETSVKRPITVAMVFILVLILGAIAFISLPLDLMPDIETPSLTVMTIYPGANPVDVEKKISEPLEKSLSTVQGLKDITSYSMEGISLITMTFNWGENLDESANDIRSTLDFATFFLPDDADKPTLFKFDFSMAPIVFYSVEIDPSIEFPVKYMQKNVVDRLMRVQGVGQVNFRGMEDDIIAIELSQEKMERFGLSIGMVQQILRGYNLSIPGGNMDVARRYITVRTDGEFSNIAAMGMVPILRGGPATIFLKDIANIDFAKTRELSVITKVNGKKGGIIFVQKASGANTVNTAKDVIAEIGEINKDLEGVKMSLFLSLAGFIEDNIKQLGKTLSFALIFVILVVLLLLMNFRAAIVVGISLPFSLIISFIFMYLFGYTINMISLGALAIAVGMVVDAAIVIFENIFRHHYILREPLKESSMYAPGEVGNAVMASVLTTVAIFFPLSFVKGFVGVFFSQLGVVVTIVLIASLITALTLIPALSSIILRKSREKTKLQDTVAKFWGRIGEKVSIFVRRSLKKGGLWIVGFTLLFLLSLLLIKTIPQEYMPDQDMGSITINMQLPAFVNIGETEKVAQDLQEMIDTYIKDPKMTRYSVGEGGARGPISSINPSIMQYSIMLSGGPSERRSSDIVANEIRDLIPQHIRGYKTFSVSAESGMSQMMGVGAGGAQLEIYGEDLDVMAANAERWKSALLAMSSVKKNRDGSPVKPVRSVEISFEKGKKEVKIVPDLARCTEVGITPAYLGMIVRTALFGAQVGEYRQSGDVFDVYINIDKSELADIQALGSLVITSPTGVKLRLEDLAELQETDSPVSIDRKNRERTITVSAVLKDSRYLGEVSKWMRTHMKDFTQTGIDFKLSGQSKDMIDSFKSLLQILVLAILLVFMVMAAQFESLKEPFIVMFSVPFAATGVFLGLSITRQTFSLNSMIGLIMLVGIVVNNAIVLVDYINTLRKRGKELKDAIEEAVRERLKPVLMTALTTMFGMLPLAIATGAGAETWRPLGVAVIGGLLVSTIITIVLVPNVYYIVEKKRKLEHKAIY